MGGFFFEKTFHICRKVVYLSFLLVSHLILELNI